MRRQTKLIWTLVYVAILSLTPEVGFTAKTSPAPDLDATTSQEPPPTEAELERARALELSPAPNIAPIRDEKDYFYSYRQALTVRAGIDEKFNDLNNPGSVLSILYWFPLADLRGCEAGADLNSDGAGTLHFSRRIVTATGKFRPFYKYGGGIRIVPSDQLVTFLRLKNWQARLGSGFEYLVGGQGSKTSVRADLDGTLSTDRLSAIVTVGVAQAW